MQTVFYRDYIAARRRVYLQLVDQTDGVTPEIGEAAGQPQLAKLGVTPTNTTALLVATDAAKGLYYVELTQVEMDTLGRSRLIYDSAATAPAEEIIEVIPHPFLHDGIAQSGGAGVITLATGASAVDDTYNDGYIVLIGGTGAGQARQIADYVGATKVVTVDLPWAIQPDATSVYVIEPGSRVPALNTVWDALTANHAAGGSFGEAWSPIRRGTAQAGGSNTITLDALASAVADFYKGGIVRILSGTGAGQAAIISAYNGTTKVATVGQNWATVPNNSSIFSIFQLGVIPGASAPTAGDVADSVWNEARADHVAAGSFGSGVLLATGVAQLIADAFIARNISGGTDGFPSIEFAMCFLAGKWSDNGDGTISVFKADDSTVLGTITYSTRVRDAIGSIDSIAAP